MSTFHVRKAHERDLERLLELYRELAEDDRHPDDAKLDRLERLGQLKEKGVLTAAEFRAEKKRILEGGNGGPPKRPRARATR